MPRYVALSHSTHRDARWKRFSSYSFASNDTFIPLVAAELARAALAMPVAFIEQQGEMVLVAVTSLMPGINLFVSTDGQWLGGYVPSALRGYPFRLVPVKDRDESVLVIDEDSGLIGTGSGFEEAEALFTSDGQPTTAVSQTLDFLKQIEINRQVTARAVAALAAEGLIEDWPITVKGEDGADRNIQGLKRIGEAKLNALDNDAFLRLRHAGALPVAYAQLLSTQNIGNFEKVVQLRDQLARMKAAQVEQPAWQLSSDDELIF
jgi:hypothetical protein